MKTKEYYRWQKGCHIILILFSLLALIPFYLLLVASFTDDSYAAKNGFGFFPKEWSIAAYQYISGQWAMIGHAYLMTLAVVTIGTLGTLTITCLFAYGLSKDDIPGIRVINFYCIFTMLFGGGIVSSYYIWVKVFHIRNTFWALVLPGMLMNAFTVILVKNYFKWSIPSELLEAARIDGASELRVFIQMVLPLSKPIIATIGLMSALGYWNDWNNGLYFLTEREGSQYYTIQIVLNTINENVKFISQNASKMKGIDVSTLPSTTIRMAIAVIGIIPIMLLYPFFQNYFVKGITLGGVKG